MVLCPDNSNRIALVSTHQAPRETTFRTTGQTPSNNRIDHQQDHVLPPIDLGLGQPLGAVHDSGVADPTHAPVTLRIIHGGNGNPMLPEHEGPVPIPTTHVHNRPPVGDDPQDLKALVGRDHTAEMVHEQGQDMMALRPGLGLGARPAPLQVAAGPGPEVKVRVRGQRGGGLLLGDGQWRGGGGRVDEAPGGQVRGDAGPHAALPRVGTKGLEGRGREAGGLKDPDVVVHIGPWRGVEGGCATGVLGGGRRRGRGGGIPGVQAVGGAEADDVLDLGEGDGGYGVVGPGVVGGELEVGLDGSGEVIVGKQGESLCPGFLVSGPGGGVEGWRADAGGGRLGHVMAGICKGGTGGGGGVAYCLFLSLVSGVWFVFLQLIEGTDDCPLSSAKSGDRVLRRSVHGPAGGLVGSTAPVRLCAVHMYVESVGWQMGGRWVADRDRGPCAERVRAIKKQIFATCGLTILCIARHTRHPDTSDHDTLVTFFGSIKVCLVGLYYACIVIPKYVGI